LSDFYIRTQALESIARQTLIRLHQNYLNFEPQAVPIEKIIEDIFGLCIDYMRLTEAGDELGRMIFDDGYSTRFNPEIDNYELVKVKIGTMLIEALLLEEARLYGRYRFTLAHELAHWILHRKLFEGTRYAASTFNTGLFTNSSTEWQANYLAKAILMPAGQIKRAFYQVRDTGLSGISRLADIFQVSREAMGYRLEEMGLI
jgi:hypothetical protein